MSKKGFTLIEVLMALTILSVSILGIVQSVSLCSRKAASAMRLSEAAEIARREMALAVISGAGGPPAAGKDEVFQWKTETSEKAEDLLLISVAVTWSEKGKSRVFNLSRMLDAGKHNE